MTSKNSKAATTVRAELREGLFVDLNVEGVTYIHKAGGSAHLRITVGTKDNPSIERVYVGSDGVDAPADKQSSSISQFLSSLVKANAEGNAPVASSEAPKPGGRGRRPGNNGGIVLHW